MSLKPSEVKDDFWIFARSKAGNYPKHTSRGGKWLIFVPVGRIDSTWEIIREATELGKLGGSAKAATMRPNPNAQNPNIKVICVYTYDCTDVSDVRRVEDALKGLGFKNLRYKADENTRAGIYSNRGHKNISQARRESK
jgi:hypothetical protein